MALQSGRISLSRYKTVGAPLKLTLKSLGEEYRKYLIKPLKISYPKELTFGWDTPALADFEEESGYWDMSHCAYQDGYILRIRIEQRKVPSSLMTMIYKQKIQEAQKNKIHLKRDQKQQIRDELKDELLLKALPELRSVDVVWSTTQQEINVLSTAKVDREVFEKLFKLSFSRSLGFNVIPLSPPMLGISSEKFKKSEILKTHFQNVNKTVPSLFTKHQSIH